MNLGVDFDGTVVRYVVCASSDGGDGRILTTVETLKAAEHELKLIINRAKKKKHSTDTKFWVMKQTFKYEKCFETELND